MVIYIHYLIYPSLGIYKWRYFYGRQVKKNGVTCFLLLWRGASSTKESCIPTASRGRIAVNSWAARRFSTRSSNCSSVSPASRSPSSACSNYVKHYDPIVPKNELENAKPWLSVTTFANILDIGQGYYVCMIKCSQETRNNLSLEISLFFQYSWEHTKQPIAIHVKIMYNYNFGVNKINSHIELNLDCKDGLRFR